MKGVNYMVVHEVSTINFVNWFRFVQLYEKHRDTEEFKLMLNFAPDIIQKQFKGVEEYATK